MNEPSRSQRSQSGGARPRRPRTLPSRTTEDQLGLAPGPAGPGAPGDEPVELGGYLRALAGSWLVVLLVVVVGTGAATAYAASRPRVYEAAAVLSLTSPIDATGSTTTPQSALTAQQVGSLTTFQRAVKDHPEYALPQLARSVTIRLDSQAGTIAVTGRSAVPRAAAAMANAVTQAFLEVDQDAEASRYAETRLRLLKLLRAEPQPAAREPILKQLGNLAVDRGTRPSEFEVVSLAVAPSTPTGPRTFRTGVLALLASFMSAAVFVAAREQVRPRARGVRQLSAVTGLPVLAELDGWRSGRWGGRPGGGSRDQLARAFEGVGTVLALRLAPVACPVVVISGVRAGDEAASSAAHLAAALAGINRKVLVASCNLRGSRLHGVLGAAQSPGLADVLSGSTRLESTLVPADPVCLDDRAAGDATQGSLLVLPSGDSRREAAGLLTEASVERLVTSIREQRFDFVVIEAPELLSHPADLRLLARVADGLVLVTSREPLPWPVANALRLVMTTLPVTPLGLVVAPRDDRAARTVRVTAAHARRRADAASSSA